MKRVDVKLSQIKPSDTPRDDSWWLQRDRVEKMNLQPPIDLSILGVTLSEAEDGSIFTKNGNHRLAALVEKFGYNTVVSGEVEPRAHTSSSWGVQLDRIAKRGINNYQDWLDRIGSDEDDD